MKISLITVCYNSAAVIRTALDSVFAQTSSSEVSAVPRQLEIEYLVIDGGSTDGTVEILKEYAARLGSAALRSAGSGRPSEGIRRYSAEGLPEEALPSMRFSFRYISEKDNGMYDALNKGIKMATGEFVGILNADDYLDGSDVLSRVAAFIEESNHLRQPQPSTSTSQATHSIDCVFGNVRFVRDFGGKTQRVCFARFWKPWMLQWGYMPPHPAIFIRRACFEKWGGYVPERTEYRIAADYELLIRFFCRNKMTHRYMPINTTVMRLGGVSTKDVEARKKLNEEIIKGNRVNGYKCYWPMLLPKYAIKIWEVILPRLGLIS